MASAAERLGIVETKVENLSGKMDELKVNVKEMHDCLDRTRNDISAQLEKMYTASCDQHAQLAKKISILEGYKTKGTYLIMGGVAAAGWITGHLDLFTKIVK